MPDKLHGSLHPHQINHTKCDIKNFTKMVDELRTKEYSLKYRLFVENYFHIIDICLEQNKSSNEEISL